ncbi:Adhesion and hyphal regulator 1 [Ceratocystis fimbriata CBS 114723]|uniref:Adhesion and hyphal regulator 1 n=1 Tax=Ceratocystis fimbriata CBS 114723 TaxID=1035309 RepID=A0A2C5X4M2_9PEZI|nr:Adhesion and hyphal regulator 1 [Ceratocystis fimbriata CBS 114723]
MEDKYQHFLTFMSGGQDAPLNFYSPDSNTDNDINLNFDADEAPSTRPPLAHSSGSSQQASYVAPSTGPAATASLVSSGDGASAAVTPISSSTAFAPTPEIHTHYNGGETTVFSVVDGQNWRRRSSGTDHVKHRRTRSGCYTCRTRRVKCDEGRPICERCRKGNRSCKYPDPDDKPRKGAKAAKPKGREEFRLPLIKATEYAHFLPSYHPLAFQKKGYSADKGVTKLETIPDLDDPEESLITGAQPPAPSAQHDPSADVAQNRTTNAGSSPNSSETSRKFSASVSPTDSTAASSAAEADGLPTRSLVSKTYSHLSSDMKDCLDWYHKNISHYHYCILSDSHEFFSVTLPRLALLDETLLYALVGFSAYLRSLANPNSSIKDFLVYFNRSISTLISHLKAREETSIVRLISVLQLATLEEYLGDWISVMGHQMAARHHILLLYNSGNFMETPVGRILLAWYSRFDCCVGIMGRFETALPNDWFINFAEVMATRTAASLPDTQLFIEEGASNLRLCSHEIAQLNYNATNNRITMEGYGAEHARILSMITSSFNTLVSRFDDPEYLIDFSQISYDVSPYQIVDLTDPKFKLYKGPFFASNVLRAEFHSIFMMLNFQQAMLDKKGSAYLDCQRHAYAICAIFEGIYRYPDAPKGALLPVQACLGLAALFFPQDSRHRSWLREMFALVETIGYIQSKSARKGMTKFFNDETIAQWWYPDEQGFTKILRSVRSYTDERNLHAQKWQEELRDMNHIFSKLTIDAE